jgi:hypothetical protein
LARGLIARQDAAHGRRDHQVDLGRRRPDLLRQGLAQPLAAVGLGEHQVLLQEHRAVQPRRKHEMPLAQRPGGTEFVKDVVGGHQSIPLAAG